MALSQTSKQGYLSKGNTLVDIEITSKSGTTTLHI
jgi:hypothetical protein